MAGQLAHGPANRGRRVLVTAAPLFVCEPAQAPRGGVIVVHDLHGLTHETEVACRRLTAEGWLAVSPFLYHEHGGPVFQESDYNRARAELAGLPMTALAEDLAASVAYLSGRGIEAPAMIGFGTGAHLALWAAVTLEGLGAVVSLSPRTAPGDVAPLTDLAAATRMPLLELPDSEQMWPRVVSFLRAGG